MILMPAKAVKNIFFWNCDLKADHKNVLANK
jgi:hypothetical protein